MKLAALIGIFCCCSAFSADQKTPVFLEISTEGQLSKQFSFEVKEAFRGSTKLSIMDDQEAASYQLRLTMLDIDDSTAVIYSWVRTAPSEPALNYYLSSTVGICGRSRILGCSRKFLAEITEEVERDGKVFAEAFLRITKEMEAKKKKQAETGSSKP